MNKSLELVSKPNRGGLANERADGLQVAIHGGVDDGRLGPRRPGEDEEASGSGFAERVREHIDRLPSHGDGLAAFLLSQDAGRRQRSGDR